MEKWRCERPPTMPGVAKQRESCTVTDQNAALAGNRLEQRLTSVPGRPQRDRGLWRRYALRLEPVVQRMTGTSDWLTRLFAGRPNATPMDAIGSGPTAMRGHDRTGDAGNDPCDRHEWFCHEVTRLVDRLYGTALRLTGNRDEAEDLVAEAVARARAGLDELQDTSRLEGWLFHVLGITFVSDWRERCRHDSTEASARAYPNEGGGNAGEWFSLFRRLRTSSLQERGIQSERFLDTLSRGDVARAMDALPEHERIVVVLVEIQGYRYREAAELLQASVGTVRARLGHGRALLQETLWRHVRDVDDP